MTYIVQSRLKEENDKVKFRVKTALDDSSNSLYGSTSSQATSITFLRLGDT